MLFTVEKHYPASLTISQVREKFKADLEDDFNEILYCKQAYPDEGIMPEGDGMLHMGQIQFEQGTYIQDMYTAIDFCLHNSRKIGRPYAIQTEYDYSMDYNSDKIQREWIVCSWYHGQEK